MRYSGVCPKVIAKCRPQSSGPLIVDCLALSKHFWLIRCKEEPRICHRGGCVSVPLPSTGGR